MIASREVNQIWLAARARTGTLTVLPSPGRGFVLTMLAVAERPRYLSEIAERTGERQGNTFRILPQLRRLGFLDATEEVIRVGSGGGRPLTVYSLTSGGARLAGALKAAGAELPEFESGLAARRRRARNRAGGLTDREMQCLGLISEGNSNRQVGAAMHLTEDTVKSHLRKLFRKLGARDRAHAVRRGFELGLLRVEPAAVGVAS